MFARLFDRDRQQQVKKVPIKVPLLLLQCHFHNNMTKGTQTTKLYHHCYNFASERAGRFVRPRCLIVRTALMRVSRICCLA